MLSLHYSCRVQGTIVGTRCSLLNNWIITNAFLQLDGHCILFRGLLYSCAIEDGCVASHGRMTDEL
jgi:hypothetical protein